MIAAEGAEVLEAGGGSEAGGALEEEGVGSEQGAALEDQGAGDSAAVVAVSEVAPLGVGVGADLGAAGRHHISYR